MIDCVEVFGVFFGLLFASTAGKGCSQAFRVPSPVQGSEALPMVDGRELRDDISKVDVCKCMQTDGMHPALLEGTS